MEIINELKQVIQITGVFGILSFATILISMVLYFMCKDKPPVWNVLLRTLVSLFCLLFVLIFFTGFQYILKNITKGQSWLITLMYTTVCIYTATNFVAHSLEAGGVLNPKGMAIDATQEGLLAQGNYLLYGSIGRLLMATYMIIISIITFKTGIFPGWTGWVALIISIVNIIFIPSMFFGTKTSDFYSAIGWGNSAVAASAFIWWVLIISIILIKNVHTYRIL
jgi:hypothetical protein